MPAVNKFKRAKETAAGADRKEEKVGDDRKVEGRETKPGQGSAAH